MRKGALLVATVAIGIVLLLFTFQFFPIRDLFSLLLSLEFIYFLPYIGVSFLIFCILTFRWHIICKEQGVTIRFWELVAYRYVGFGVSFLTPGPRVGGEPVRAALMRRNKISFPKALSTVIADKTIELASFGMMISLFTLLVVLFLPLPPILQTTLGVISGIVFLLVLSAFFQLLRGKDPVLNTLRMLRLDKLKLVQKYAKELHEFEHSITQFYKEGKTMFWRSVGLSWIAWLASLVEFKLLLLLLGIDANLIQIFLIYAVVGIVYMIPIPLALGSLEAAQTTVFSSVGFAKEAGVALAIITRGRDLFWSLIGFMLLSYYGFDAIRAPKEAKM